MTSSLLDDLVLKGGFAVEIPARLGIRTYVSNIECCVTFATKDPTFNAAFAFDEPMTHSKIEQIESFFRIHKVPFCFVTSNKLTARETLITLTELGYVPYQTLSGMVLDVEKINDDETAICKKTIIAKCSDNELAAAMYADAYPMNMEEARIMVSALAELGFESYVAYENQNEAAAIATICILSCGLSESIAYLGGAATLPRMRNRGIYNRLLKERLRIAKLAGCKSVVVQCNVETSMATCKSVGFREVDRITQYVRKGVDND